MKVVVVGGTGHIGSYLVPRLVAGGHEVVVVTRGSREPYWPHPAWLTVQRVQIDREVAEAAGTFGQVIRGLGPDVVIDLLCFRIESAQQLVEALRGQVQQLLHCGTCWVHGFGVEVPIAEDQPRAPIGEYGIRKVQVEAYLLDQARRHGLPATVLHPGHIVGPGWVPIGPTGCWDAGVFSRLARGKEVVLPNLGLETLHHVHADDVAKGFVRAMTHWRSAVGESFNLASPAALTMRGFAESAAGWFGRKANLRFRPIEEWQATLPPESVEIALAHVEHSSNYSIAKARRLLEYEPRYTSLEALRESVLWLVEHGQLSVGS